jgi:purine-binding chemotaxis protein CheW
MIGAVQAAAALVDRPDRPWPDAPGSDALDYVSVLVGGQLFGLPINRVRDVFMVQSMTAVPLAPPEIAGLINLRGRIATAIDLRRRLGLPAAATADLMAVGIEARGESYGLIVEGVGEVMRLGPDTRDENPIHLSGPWAALSRCVHRLENHLLVVLDVEAVLDLDAVAS